MCDQQRHRKLAEETLERSPSRPVDPDTVTGEDVFPLSGR